MGMNAIRYIRRFKPRHDKITNVMAVGAVGGLIGAALLTSDEALCTTKLLRLAGGAIAGGLSGLLLPRLFYPREW